MKIFLIASIHGKRKVEENCRKIVQFFENLGHKVISDHIFNVTSDILSGWDEEKDIKFHRKVLTGIRQADIVIAELSYASTSVGYLVSHAVESGKPTIAFYRGNEVPHLLTTLARNEKFQVLHYNDVQEVQKEIPILIEYATSVSDTRFNFFISRRLLNYLDWIAKKRRVPRAVYLRQLIKREMNKYSEFRLERKTR